MESVARWVPTGRAAGDEQFAYVVLGPCGGRTTDGHTGIETVVRGPIEGTLTPRSPQPVADP